MPYAQESQEAHAVRLAKEYGQSYRVPAGFYDRHFYYIYDGVGNQPTIPPLVTGQNYDNISILLYPDSEFILRRVNWFSAGNASSTFNFSWPDFSRKFAYYNPLPYTCSDMPIIPEIMYPAGGQIRVEINNYQPKNNVYVSTQQPYGQFVFQGVQRFKGVEHDFSTYPSCRKVYQVYTLDFELDWSYFNAMTNTNGVGPLHRFSVKVNEGDFELWAIGSNAENYLSFNLIDPIDKTLFTNNIPILNGAFLDASAPNEGTGQKSAGTWGAMVPPKFYPFGSDIVIDVASLIPDPADGGPIQFQFIGMTRRPK